MYISVELTYTPMQENYGDAILSFVEALDKSELTIKKTPVSTQIFGEYDEVMNIINRETKKAFGNTERAMMFIKIAK